MTLINTWKVSLVGNLSAPAVTTIHKELIIMAPDAQSAVSEVLDWIGEADWEIKSVEWLSDQGLQN